MRTAYQPADDHPPTRFRLLTLAALLGCLVASTAAAEEPPAPKPGEPVITAGLQPFVLPWDDGSLGPTSMAFLNHRPAGSLGRIVVDADGHLSAAGRRQRFFGTNLCFTAAAPDSADAPLIAGRLAKFGINLVRLHHLDNPQCLLAGEAGKTGQLDPANLARFDSLCAALLAEGIYLNINLLVSRPLEREKPWPQAVLPKGKLDHLLGLWHPGALALQQDYARQLLTHVNPHTGRSYAQEPGVLCVEIVNENGLVNYWLDAKRKPDLSELDPEFLAPLQQRWHGWLATRHADDAACIQRWGSPAAQVPIPGSLTDPLQREEWIAFLMRLETDYFSGMRDFLRRQLGVQALLMGTTAASASIAGQAGLDIVDSHVYYQNPHWRAGTWNYAARQWSIEQRSQAEESVGGRLRWVASTAIAGKPFSLSEFNQSAPGAMAGESPLYMAVTAARQDWDAIYLFAYQHARDWRSARIMGLNCNEHPTKMANAMAAAALFRRADLPAATAAATAALDPTREAELIAARGQPWNLLTAFGLGVNADCILDRRIRIGVGAAGEAMRPPVTKGPSPVCSVGGDGLVIHDLRLAPGAERGGTLSWSTPHHCGVLGLAAGARFDLGFAHLSLEPTAFAAACVSLVVLEGSGLDAPGPRRAVLVTTADAENSGMRWRRFAVPGATDRWELDDWGKAPTVVETVQGWIEVPGAADDVQCWRLDERGQQADAIPVVASPTAAGWSRIPLGAQGTTLWYALAWTHGTVIGRQRQVAATEAAPATGTGADQDNDPTK